MAATLIDGNSLAAHLREKLKRDVADLRSYGKSVRLTAVLIGDDASAASYARSQAKHAESVGIGYDLVQLPPNTTMPQATEAIERLNHDAAVSGVMLHMPVPKGLDGFALQQRIAAVKDVEGVSAENLGLLAMGREALAPCTAAAAFACLQSTGVEIRGKRAVVIGRSVIVGKPLAMMLIGANATVTQCHTQTRDLVSHTRNAEILMVAAGRAGLIGAEHVSPGAIVIDVGTHRVPVRQADGTEKMTTVGDVRFDEVVPLASHLTPVPGGVGPVTVAMLLANTVAAARGV
ncbi:MAG: bifunctional 5,10-methylenetetrahydrofolate dehydrogenase/5,10-methenyltetrahydrofolate cyclohydrolase [Planctomycetes bacterium]|nr:bifunctional 5,10-methylenetetrahydrofolate dehydrogenase/5,10-methenyltetrahydrofolate cyclohydrolase [Planctomycetota bacterium]